MCSFQALDARSRTTNNTGMMGAKMYPYLANFKGFDKTTTGLQLSIEDRSGKRGQESVNSFNLYYVKPELKNFPTFKVNKQNLSTKIVVMIRPLVTTVQQ